MVRTSVVCGKLSQTKEVSQLANFWRSSEVTFTEIGRLATVTSQTTWPCFAISSFEFATRGDSEGGKRHKRHKDWKAIPIIF